MSGCRKLDEAKKMKLFRVACARILNIQKSECVQMNSRTLPKLAFLHPQEKYKSQ